MKAGDAIEYQSTHDRTWRKARMVGTLKNGNFVVECAIGGVITREKHEVRMPKVKVTRWVNLYRHGHDEAVSGGRLHYTEEDAKSYSKDSPVYITTVPVTWEE